MDAAPEVFNHNTEPYRVVSPGRGPKSSYRWTLELLQSVRAANPADSQQDGLMLGLGKVATRSWTY